MPELPEVEILRRHLDPLLDGRTIQQVTVRSSRSVRPAAPEILDQTLRGVRLGPVRRRGKFLLITDATPKPNPSHTCAFTCHLGMTGRLFLRPTKQEPGKHDVVLIELTPGDQTLVFQDPRRFGFLTPGTCLPRELGPEAGDIQPEDLRRALMGSRQAIKARLLDQGLVAGLGNIYASEALHRAGISPLQEARTLTREQLHRLIDSVRFTLEEAIRLGSGLSLDFTGRNIMDRVFYYGSTLPESGQERFQVYDREGKPCHRCGTLVNRSILNTRSTFWCPACQATPTQEQTS